VWCGVRSTLLTGVMHKKVGPANCGVWNAEYEVHVGSHLQLSIEFFLKDPRLEL
jgi:hypothetical protein